MILILAANHAEGKTFQKDHKFSDHDVVIIFDLVDLPTLDGYEFQSILVTNGFLTKPKLHELWRSAIKRLRLPRREDV
jgi:hypothetical protein